MFDLQLDFWREQPNINISGHIVYIYLTVCQHNLVHSKSYVVMFCAGPPLRISYLGMVDFRVRLPCSDNGSTCVFFSLRYVYEAMVHKHLIGVLSFLLTVHTVCAGFRPEEVSIDIVLVLLLFHLSLLWILTWGA